MNKSNFIKPFLYPLLIVVVAAIFMIPTWTGGISDGVDLDQHFQFASSIERAILTGDYFPHWAGQENHGYGGIGMRFYPPTAYYVLASAKILTNDWFWASCLAFFFWAALSGFGVYYWAREWFSEKASFAAAALYIFAPYHVLQLYSAFIYAEFAASAILPFCLMFITRICRRGKWADVLGFSFFYAFLIFTHIPLAIIGSLAIGFYSLTQINFRNFFSTAGKLFTGLVLGLAGSSFQWVKVVSEMQWLNHTTEQYSQSGLYDYRQNFLLSFPYLAGLDADNRSLWFADLSLLVTLIFTVPFAVLYFKKVESAFKRQIYGVLFLAVFAIFMASYPSRPLWDALTLLQKVQFPWRWFSVISMSLVILSAAGFEYYRSLAKDRQTRPTFLLLTGCLITCFVFSHAQIIRQALTLPWEKFTVRSQKFAATENCECWLPVWATLETQKVQEKVISEGRNVTINSWQDREIKLTFDEGKEAKARLAVHYYPHWKATVNNQPIELKKTDDGAILIPLSTEKAEVRLWFEEPAKVVFAAYLSAITLSILAMFGLFTAFWGNKRKDL